MEATTISLDSDLETPVQAAPDFSGMAPYRPISRAAALETFVPQSMAFETRQALLRLQMLVGNVDTYVTNKLKYLDIATMHSYFSAEQVDAIALAVYNIENGEGIIIGDQTGIGKGRIAAGIIRYGCMNGRPTIMVTEKPTLFSDLFRDLYDIGSVGLVPLIINTDPAATIQINLDAETIVKVHEHMGNDKYKPKTLPELRQLLREYNGEDLPEVYEPDSGERISLPPGYNFLMVTYSQMSDDIVAKGMMKKQGIAVNIPKGPGPGQFKTSFIANYAQGAVVILDEAHNASGGESATGFFIRYGILERCAGCCYLSATFAKRPDNMSVYAAKTAIKHTGLAAVDLAMAFVKGGVPMQEIVAAQLVASGQMLRRQRTFEGIEVEYNYLPERYAEHVEIYDKVIRIVDAIIHFEREFVAPLLEELAETMGFGGDKADKTMGTKEGGINNSPFFNKTHHVIRQLLFSIKAKDVAREAIQSLNENRKVVIAFSSTMESFVDELGLVNGDEVVNADFALVLEKCLTNSLKYTVSSGSNLNGNYTAEHHLLTEDDFSGEGASILAGIKNEIATISTGIMLSPIDTLINEIQQHRKPANVGGEKHEYYLVRECTGRKGQMRMEDGRLMYRSFKANVKQFFAEFNSGEADVLLINQSASTGVSAHSSGKVKDQRQREMIIHQPELDINTEVQKRGRINRTGQVNKPRYKYVSSSIPAEKRIFMVLKRKLKSLDANTTGNQRSSQQVLETEDFFNRYGDRVVNDFLRENLPVAWALDMVPGEAKEDGREENPGNDPAETFSRRIALLPVAQQERCYKEVIEKYNEMIADLKERGEYDLEVEYLDLQAETLESTILVMGSGMPSPFGRHAVMETVSAQILRRPFKWSQVEAAIKSSLQDKSASSLQFEMVYEYKTGRAQMLIEKTARLNKEIAEAEAKLQLPVAEGKEKQALKWEARLAELQVELGDLQGRHQTDTNNGERMLNFFRIGKSIKFARGERQHMGVVTNVYFAKPSDDPNRYSHANIRIAVAVYGPERSSTLKFNQSETIAAVQLTESTPQSFLDDLLYNWNRMEVKDKKREKLQIASNNVLLAIKEIPKGRLVKFTQDNGSIRSGILVEAERNRQGEAIVEKPTTRRPINLLFEEMSQASYGKNYYIIGDSLKNSITFKRRYNGGFEVSLPSTKLFKPYWSNQDLIDLLQPTYAGAQRAFKTFAGNLFGGVIADYNLRAFLQILWDKHQLTYEGEPINYNSSEDVPLPEVVVETEVVYTVQKPAEPAISVDELRELLEMLEMELEYAEA